MSLFKPDVSKLEEKRNVQGLIRALSHKDPDIRRASALALGRLRDPSASPALVPLLGDDSYGVPAVVASALVAIGGRQTIAAVSPAIRNSDKYVRERAISVLGEIGGDLAAEVLAGVVRGGDIGMRREAVRALCKAGSEKALAPLAYALDDMEYDIRVAAAEALTNYGSRAVEPLIACLIKKADAGNVKATLSDTQMIKALGKLGDGRAIAILARLAQHRDSVIRSNAINSISVIGGKAAIAPLAKAIGDKDQSIRETAIEGLGRIRDSKAIEPLAHALSDENYDIRRCAARAIENFNDPKVAEALTACLQHENYAVVMNAAETLIKMNYAIDPEIHMQCLLHLMKWDEVVPFGARVLNSLAKKLNNKELDSSVKKSISNAIGSIGGPEALKILFQSLYWGNECAWENIARFGADAVPPLLELVRNADNPLSLRQAAVQTLGKIGLGISEEDRILCLVLLCKVDKAAMLGAKAIPALACCLRDAEPQVRRVAASVLDKLAYSPDPETLPWYLLAQGRLEELASLGRDAAEPIAELLKSENKVQRNWAAEKLQELGMPDNPKIRAWHSIATEKWSLIRQLGEDAVGPLMEVIRNNWGEPYISHSIAALGAIGTTKAVLFLIQALNRFNFKEVTKALGNTGDRRAVPVLVRMLYDDELDRRTAAASALVMLFQCGKLSDSDKLEILKEKSRIEARHDDRIENEVYISTPRCTYWRGDHVDSGIGIPFPA